MDIRILATRLARRRRLTAPAGAGLLFLGGLVWLAHAWRSWPDVSSLRGRPPDQVAAIERNRAVMGVGQIGWTWVRLVDISPHLIRAVLVAEDIEFFSHRGFAWAEIRNAWRDAREGGRPRGASTITQQLARVLWLGPERTLWRKLREAVLTVEMERRLSKRRILELYLNVVEFGPGTFGAEAAAQRYFGKSALFLTERESAMLAVGLSRPSQWNPSVTTPAYVERVDLVMRRMMVAEFLWRHISDLWYRG